jgi:hypothetical protein
VQHVGAVTAVHGIASPALLAALVFGVLVLAFAISSRALARRLVTAPLAFVAAGAALGFLTGPVLATISVAVLLSVLLHGMSAPPAARRYGRWAQEVQPQAELRTSFEPRVRGRLLAGTGRPEEDCPFDAAP